MRVNKQPSSRYVPGSGIYRDVNPLQVTDNYVEKNGTTILTPKLEQQQHGQGWNSHVASSIVNTDDKDHELAGEYQIVGGGQAVIFGSYSEVNSWAHESTSLGAILEVE